MQPFHIPTSAHILYGLHMWTSFNDEGGGEVAYTDIQIRIQAVSAGAWLHRDMFTRCLHTKGWFTGLPRNSDEWSRQAQRKRASSSDKLSGGLVQSDRGSFVNSLSEPIRDSVISPHPRLALVDALLVLFNLSDENRSFSGGEKHINYVWFATFCDFLNATDINVPIQRMNW